jgi:hypothetical protein
MQLGIVRHSQKRCQHRRNTRMLRMPSQQEIIKRARDSDRIKTGRVKKTLEPKTISKLLRKIYQPTARKSELSFWAQHENGMPLYKVATEVASERAYCTVAFQNELDAAKWRDVEKPQNSGELSFWPPKKAADLLECSTFGETCIECASTDTKILQDEVYLDWSAEMYNFWL